MMAGTEEDDHCLDRGVPNPAAADLRTIGKEYP